MKKLIVAFALLFQFSQAFAWVHGYNPTPINLARSQFGPNFFQSFTSEYPLLNMFKQTPNWVYANNSGTPKPDELDTNGYLLSGANWTTQTGAYKLVQIPLQAENPGDRVLLWLGQGKFSYAPNGFAVTASTCSATKTGSTFPACDNTGCSTFTGSIAPDPSNNGILTVTAAPTGTNCTIALGIPVSGQIATFDTMTVVTGNASTNSNLCSPACTGTGGTGTYAVNISQTQISGTMVMGARFQVSFGSSVGYVGTTPSNAIQLNMNITQTATGSGSQRVVDIAEFSINDEAAYQNSHKPCGNGKACIVGTAFKNRMKEGNFAVFRDLNWGQGNTGNCSTWSCRKPLLSHSYGANELRNAASGNETYTVQGTVYTIPKIGQYVNASGTGASGGTISYNAGTDTYSITLGSGAPVDKQTITILMPSAGTTSSKISLNGNTAVPLLAPYGGVLTSSFTPISGEVGTIVYDAVIGGFLYFTPHNANSARGLDAGVPPEVTMEIAAELGMALWHVPPYLSQDPTTDWITQHATYQRNNYSFSALNLANLKGPIYEPQNEPFNCIQFNAAYMAYKSFQYHSTDPTAWPSGGYSCGPAGGDNYAWMGKIASTAGQDLASVYGDGNFELTVAVQTSYPPGSQLYPALTSRQYVAQTLISAQAGYTQTAAYLHATRVSNSNYWNPGVYCGGGDSGAGPCSITKQNGYLGLEVAYAYCYYYYTTSSACQGIYANQAAAMTAYMNTSLQSPCGDNLSSCGNLASIVNYVTGWAAQAQNCFNGASRPVGCRVNQTSPIFMYEGTFSMLKLQNDLYNTFTSATNATTAVLSIASTGCVPGMTVQLSALTGGTWSTAAGSYTVQASGTDANHCAINLDSTALGTLTGGRITYTGSQTYVNVLRQYAYVSPDLTTLTTTLYNNLISAGAQNPSQFNFNDNGPYFDSPWLIGSSIYSGLQTAICQGCTISGTTLTLGGTISMMFRTGDILYGTGVTGPGAGSSINTVLGACTPIGANVCGTTAGDTFTLNQASTVASATRMTTVAPALSTAWNAIRAWNGNP